MLCIIWISVCFWVQADVLPLILTLTGLSAECMRGYSQKLLTLGLNFKKWSFLSATCINLTHLSVKSTLHLWHVSQILTPLLLFNQWQGLGRGILTEASSRKTLFSFTNLQQHNVLWWVESQQNQEPSVCTLPHFEITFMYNFFKVCGKLPDSENKLNFVFYTVISQ